MARLWQRALLAQWNPVFEGLPVEAVILASREEYYSAIAACHRAGSADVFLEYMLGAIDQTLTRELESLPL